MTRQLNKKDLDLRTLSFRWFLCPKLYGTLILVASTRQAPYLACLRVLRLAIRPLDHNSRIRVSSILVLVVQVTTRIRRRSIFFLQVASRKKGINQVPTSYLQDSASSFVLSYESLKSRKRRISFPTRYIQRHVRGSR